ncbi:MAG: V-type ATP synthase subunit D [Spartobacteria bacterium]|nr:V-type ATP synthase subunit D [Spartobacteria bacterium]
MAKVKLTKNEQKSQRDALSRFRRYLPTLQLKKQQLQLELRQLEAKIEEKRKQEEQALNGLKSWISLFSEPVDFSSYVKLKEVKVSDGNIAGVSIPVLDRLEFETHMPDLFETDPWIDDGVRVLKELLQLRVERLVMREQEERLHDELRTTNQRVNLFEKVKIPECRENIRKINIFLGDQQTSAVARAKIAKGKTMAREIAARNKAKAVVEFS